MKKYTILFISIILLICNCQNLKTGSDEEGKILNDQILESATISNGSGMEVKVINYGGIITSIKVPDKNGNFDDVVLGFDKMEDYLGEHPYFGALIGRYGNRIAKGIFQIDGKIYQLAQNNNANHLHGGIKGFDKVYWDILKRKTDDGQQIILQYESRDMEEGYPGDLSIIVKYTVTEDNQLKIEYKASTTKKTIVNLTNHSYFNLEGKSQNTILDHKLTLNANEFSPIDISLIPNGILQNVAGTPFDFTREKSIGKDILLEDEQLKFGGGYDHNFVLNKDKELSLAARVFEPTSGRIMEVFTTEPGIQFYSGNFLDGTLKGKDRIAYQYRSGFCLETQHFPNSPNQPNFPTTILHPEEIYESTTIYKFSVLKKGP
ncbi:aldose epimerase family protein [Flexithrix dorotheae]|uniref:aldose epimerase family protein n=1 Tax=Flexithrix dorotheae TaxID=70993 RepID=UPI00036CAF61|nr:aldose epimerase family protein [Flexithrix dorotheae]